MHMMSYAYAYGSMHMMSHVNSWTNKTQRCAIIQETGHKNQVSNDLYASFVCSISHKYWK